MVIKNEDVKYGVNNNLINKEKICYSPDTVRSNIKGNVFPDYNFTLEKWLNHCKKNNYNSFLPSAPAEGVYDSFKSYRTGNFYIS